MATPRKATASKATAAPAAAEKVAPVTVETVQFGEIAPAASDNPFGRGSYKSIPADHALLKAVQDSFNAGRAVDVKSEDPAGLVKFLRRCANQLGYGLRTKITDNTVTFLARERQTRPRKGTDENAAAAPATGA